MFVLVYKNRVIGAWKVSIFSYYDFSWKSALNMSPDLMNTGHDCDCGTHEYDFKNKKRRYDEKFPITDDFRKRRGRCFGIALLRSR